MCVCVQEVTLGFYGINLRHLSYIHRYRLKFWKAPRRKVYAIRKFDREQKLKQKSKRSAIILDDSDEDVEEGPKKRSRIQSDTFEEIKEDIAEIASVVQEIKELDRTNSVPLALKQLIIDAFKCKICLQAPMAAPPIFSRCCKTLLGCESVLTAGTPVMTL